MFLKLLWQIDCTWFITKSLSMRNAIQFNLKTLLLASLFLYSCSSKNLLTMGVTEPTPVTIHPEIKSIGILNRSIPSEKNKGLDKLDKILSVEGKDLDKDGANSAIAGLQDELAMNNNLTEIKILDSCDESNTGLSVFPAPIPWKKIEQICQENGIDAIFELAFYDTETNIDYQATPTEIETPIGIDIPVVEQQVTVNTLIKTGWRIYDPKYKFIPDEFIINENVISSGQGINPAKAIEAIVGRKEAVLQVSGNIGHSYAIRILPYKTRVSRYYYVRGTNNFKIAKRRAQTGDWDGAAKLWKKEINHPKRKVAGRACYHMPIINEINGNLNEAVDWASKAYIDYKNNMALRYLNGLKQRIAKNEHLDRQTASK